MFSEELSEEDGKAAWAEYREQITKYDNATYYGALQTQWDAGVQPSDIVSYLDTGTSAGPSTTKAAGTGQNAAAQPHHANDLLTVLSNTNRNVQSLIQYLREKDSLATTLVDCQRHRVPVSPNLTAMLAENGKNITTHYALAEEGVRRVNSTLQKCQLGQLHLEPGANKLANELRSKLIKSLDILRFGSKKPRANEMGSGAGVPMQHQAAILQHTHQVAQANPRQSSSREARASGLNFHQK